MYRYPQLIRAVGALMQLEGTLGPGRLQLQDPAAARTAEPAHTPASGRKRSRAADEGEMSDEDDGEADRR